MTEAKVVADPLGGVERLAGQRSGLVQATPGATP